MAFPAPVPDSRSRTIFNENPTALFKTLPIYMPHSVPDPLRLSCRLCGTAGNRCREHGYFGAGGAVLQLCNLPFDGGNHVARGQRPAAAPRLAPPSTPGTARLPPPVRLGRPPGLPGFLRRQKRELQPRPEPPHRGGQLTSPAICGQAWELA